ncbi:MAG: HEAT repeat domain-containing protein [Candidatus Eremiobacteraeota bacterium]|nr:HEAT repeat domain-containing protein [Candidatus Eremiobacteraeota bacterium]MBC5826298.1 HEAT repeat domain-containing protein [Candidatus Eremiobacteraeota bacterium]
MSQACCRNRWTCDAGLAGERGPFALPDSRPRYGPDRPARVDHIALTLSFDFADKTLFGRCVTRITAVDDLVRSLEMDAAQLTIERLTDESGAALDFTQLGPKLSVVLATPLGRGKSAAVVIDYQVRHPRQGMYFVGPDAAYPDKPVQVWTQSQDQDAHYWFPCIDHPNAKCTTEITATVPRGFFVLSNGVLAATSADARKKTTTYHWKMDVPHATYLVSCVAGKFAAHTDMVGDLPVSYYVTPGREADAARSFGKTPAMVEFFSGRLRFPYPYAKYAQIAVNDFVFGGMENTTATTQTDLTLHDARAHLDYSSDALVAHELAHQWFGDLLTCKDWSHAWLNEGFATYFEAMFRESDRGADEFEYYRMELQERYLREDRELYRRPIVTNIYSEPIDLFDRHLYEKGACVLHMLRVQLGEKLWWRTMHHYVSSNQRRTVETIDLARSIEEVSGRNFLPFFDQWLFSGGHPDLLVGFRWDASIKAAQVSVRQRQSPDDGTPVFTFPASIEFGVESGSPSRFNVLCDAREQTFFFPLKATPKIFRFDPSADVLKSIELDVPVEMLLEQLKADSRVAGRVEAARALAKNPRPDVIDALAAAAKGDRFWGVQAEAARALGRAQGDVALQRLLGVRKVRHPKARRAVAEAIGEYRQETAFAALRPMLAKDVSYFVEASAATSIGKTKSAGAFDVLADALAKKDSWNEVIRCGVLAGLAELGDDRAIKLVIDWTCYGKPTTVRCAAVTALAKLGEADKRARDAVFAALEDTSLFVRLAAVDALETLRERKALERLDALASEDVDGRLKRRSAKAAQAIRAQPGKPEEMRRLREELDELRAANGQLRSRLDALESREKKRRTSRSA